MEKAELILHQLLRRLDKREEKGAVSMERRMRLRITHVDTSKVPTTKMKLSLLLSFSRKKCAGRDGLAWLMEMKELRSPRQVI